MNYLFKLGLVVFAVTLTALVSVSVIGYAQGPGGDIVRPSVAL